MKTASLLFIGIAGQHVLYTIGHEVISLMVDALTGFYVIIKIREHLRNKK